MTARRRLHELVDALPRRHVQPATHLVEGLALLAQVDLRTKAQGRAKQRDKAEADTRRED